MSIIQAILLGLIQGVTSALPVSSSGHIVLAASWMGLNADISLKFLTFLHIGTLLAVLYCFRREFLKIITALLYMIVAIGKNISILITNAIHKDKQKYVPVIPGTIGRTTLFLLVSTAASTAVALVLRGVAEASAGNLLVCFMGFMITALLLFVSSFSSRRERKIKEVRYGDALIAGVFQGISVIPGISRFGMVYAAGSLLGINGSVKTVFAYLLAVPAVLGGLILERGQAGAVSISEIGILPCIVGVAVAAVAGIFTIRFARKRLKKNLSRGFVIYCTAAAVLSVLSYIIIG
ncbi:MAG: undecaprenyl-diphosphate phosphatase [Eubacteriales bacterium]|jgi:undecaprenyl-diphosphatase